MWRKGEGSDVRRALKQARRRQAWIRRLPPRELERIVATVESDLEAFPTKDSLLEHLARLHFDARARQEAIGLEEARRHPDSARRIVETAIFERRYGVKLLDVLSRCEFVVKIPTRFSINVGMAGAIVLYDRLISIGGYGSRPLAPGRRQPDIPPQHHGVRPSCVPGNDISEIGPLISERQPFPTRESMPAALEISHLRKVYRSGTVAVEDLSMTIAARRFLRLSRSQRRGQVDDHPLHDRHRDDHLRHVEMFGIDAVKNYREARRLIGLSPQEFNVDQFATPRQIVDWMGGYFGMSAAAAQIAHRHADRAVRA